MHLRRRSVRSVRFFVPVLAIAALAAGCSSSPPKKPAAVSPVVKVPQPANCKIGTTSNPTPHVSIGLTGTAKAGVTVKQLSAAIHIPSDTTMPCASGAAYTSATPIGVNIFVLRGATAANQQTIAATLRATGLLASVTIKPLP